MSTYLRLLYIAFWMLPVQRYCTVIGLGLMAGLGATLYSPSRATIWLAGWGYCIALVGPALVAGAFWRALSAPRVVSLAPRGRMRLLLGTLAIAASVPLSALALGTLYSLGMPETGALVSFLGTYRLMDTIREALALLAATAPWIGLWLIACFVVSRSPLAMLLALITFVVSVYLLWRFDFLDGKGPRALWMREWGYVLPLVAWAVFSGWYLLARRIRPPGWLLPGGQSVLAAVALAEPAATVIGPRAALERLLLGGSSVARLLAQWLIVYATLLCLLMLLAWVDEDEDTAQFVARIAFAALILFPAIVAAQAVAIVRRARVVWLASGFSRAELYVFTGRTLLKFTLGMAMLSAALLLLHWNTQPWRPELTVAQLLALTLLPGLFASATALYRPAGQVAYWPLVALVLWFVAWCPLTEMRWFIDAGPVTTSSAAIWNGNSGMVWNAFAVAAIFLQVALARGRWQAEDLPRAATSPAS